MRPEVVRRTAIWLAVFAYLSLIFYLSSQPDPLPSVAGRFWDKGWHFLEYCVLGLLVGLALRWSGSSTWRAAILAFAFASLYGVSDELHQSFVPGRVADVRDWVADTLGAAAGALIASWSRSSRRGRQEEPR